VSAAILAALTVQQRTVEFAGAVSSLPPRTNVSEGGLTPNGKIFNLTKIGRKIFFVVFLEFFYCGVKFLLSLCAFT
jgi:hypothetical protein